MTEGVDTVKRANSIIQQEMTEDFAILQKAIDVRSMNNVVAALSLCSHGFYGCLRYHTEVGVAELAIKRCNDSELSACEVM